MRHFAGRLRAGLNRMLSTVRLLSSSEFTLSRRSLLCLAGAAAVANLRGMAAATAQRSLGERLADDLLWSQPVRERNFAHMDRVFPSNVVPHGASVRSLPAGDPLRLRPGLLERYIAEQHAAGLLVLQDGRVRAELYSPRMPSIRGGEHVRWTSFSVTKSITSTLAGAAILDGSIRSVDEPLTVHLPEMRGSAYDGVTVRQLLTMTTGVRWIEDYTAPGSDNVRLYRTPAAAGSDAVVEYMRHLPRAAAPGSRWNYNTGEADLLGVLLRRAVGGSLSAYLARKIWQPYGMEANATWIADGGREFGGSGLSACLRDFGRFGQFVLDGGAGVVPEGWWKAATEPQAATDTPGRGYGYGWWALEDGSFGALGIFGQSILIDRSRQLVVVLLSAWPEAVSAARSSARAALWEQIRSAL